MTTLEQIKNYRGQRQQEALATYRQLLRAIADDKPVKIEAVSVAMAAAGKTDADLQRDLDRYRQRKAWASKLTLMDKLEAERDAKLAEDARAEAKIKAARLEYEREIHTLRPTLQALHLELAQIEEARAALVRDCDDPTILVRERALAAEVKKLEVERASIDYELSGQRRGSPGYHRQIAVQQLAQLEGSEKPAAGPFGFLAKRNGEIEALKKQLAAIDKNSIAPLQVRLAEIAKRRGQIEREQAALDALKLLP